MTHLLVLSSIKYTPVHVFSHVLETLLEYIPSGHSVMHVLLNPNKDGFEGHILVMHDIVVGSAKVTPGQIYTHSSDAPAS